MKKKTSGNRITSFVMLVLYFLMIIASIGCTNEGTSTDTTKKDTTTVAAAATAWNGRFPFLQISKTDLDAYFNPPRNCVKIVLKFEFADANAQPSLVPYGARGIRMFDPPGPPLTKVGTPFPLPYNLILGNLEITRDLHRYLTGIYQSGTHLTLVPGISTNYPRSVTYRAYWSPEFSAAFVPKKFEDLAVPDELNPSPPAEPGQ